MLRRLGKIRGWIYSVHVGSWGGMLTRLLTFIAALIGATLPLTGYYLWIKRNLEKEIKSKLNLFVIRLGGEKSFISFII